MKIFNKFSALFLLTVALLTFTGCPRALQNVDGVDFKSESMAEIFGEIFSKKPERITQDDLAAIIRLSIVTYTDTRELSVMFKGYYEAKDLGLDTSKYLRTADLNDKSLNDMSDMSYLTSLKAFSATYTSFADFNFLSNCKELEEFNVMYDHTANDFSVLKDLPKLKSVNIESASFSDYSVFASLANLESLCLNGTYSGEDYFDTSFLKGLKNLEELSLTNMLVGDVWHISDLSGIKRLNLGRNVIEDVSPLAKLSKLEYLNLEYNLIEDVSPLVTFDKENLDRLILDGNSFIDDWSSLDYLGDKVQGRPIMVHSVDLAKIFGSQNGSVKKTDLESVESVEIVKVGNEYHLTLGFTGYLEAYASLGIVPESLYKKIVLTETVEEFCEHFDGFINLVAFMSSGVDYLDFEFLNKTKLTLSVFEVVGNKIDADYSKLSEMKNLLFVSVKDSVISDKEFFYSLENLDRLVID